MKIEWVGRWPVLVIYKSSFLHGFSGYCYGPVVIIHPSMRKYNGVLAHELTHAAQFYSGCLVHIFKYFTDDRYRLRCEVDAYNVQLTASRPGITRGEAAYCLANNYGFMIDQIEALSLLRGEKGISDENN